MIILDTDHVTVLRYPEHSGGFTQMKALDRKIRRLSRKSEAAESDYCAESDNMYTNVLIR